MPDASVLFIMKVTLTALLVLSIVAASDAEADWGSTDYDYATRQLDTFTDNFERDLVDPNARRHQRDANQRARHQRSTRVAARKPRMPAVLAASEPIALRAQRTTQYQRMLTGYHAFARQLGIPRYDVAGAVAAFIGGSYMAYRNVDLSDAQFKALVDQIRVVLVASPDFARVSLAEKQDMFEQFAIIGMTMANARLANPRAQAQPESTRAAAKQYLESYLKVEADRVAIGDRGLALAPANR